MNRGEGAQAGSATGLTAEGSPTAARELRDIAPRIRHPVVDVVLRIAKQPFGAIFGSVILALIVIAIGAPWIAPYDPLALSVDIFDGPSFAHPFGTDDLGRDQLSRIIREPWMIRLS